MKKRKILSDCITVAGGLLKSFEGAKDYSKLKLKDKISLVIEDMNFMKKIELEEMKQMITKSRKEIDDLKAKLYKIEKKLTKKK
jgi:polyhydroxyalkanoate synthesis regulator phasin